RLGWAVAALFGRRLADGAVVALAEMGGERIIHGVAALVDGVELGPRFLVAPGEPQTNVVECVPRAVGASQRPGGRLAHVADAERIDEALQPDLAPRLDRTKQVADRGLTKALVFFQFDGSVFCLQREDLRRLPHPALFVEKFDLLLAQAVDVEGAARHEMLQMLDPLERTGEVAGATRHRAGLAGSGRIAHDVRVQIAWTGLGEM